MCTCCLGLERHLCQTMGAHSLWQYVSNVLIPWTSQYTKYPSGRVYTPSPPSSIFVNVCFEHLCFEQKKCHVIFFHKTSGGLDLGKNWHINFIELSHPETYCVPRFTVSWTPESNAAVFMHTGLIVSLCRVSAISLCYYVQDLLL